MGPPAVQCGLLHDEGAKADLGFKIWHGLAMGHGPWEDGPVTRSGYAVMQIRAFWNDSLTIYHNGKTLPVMLIRTSGKSSRGSTVNE